jgi:hypothetical protein
MGAKSRKQFEVGNKFAAAYLIMIQEEAFQTSCQASVHFSKFPSIATSPANEISGAADHIADFHIPGIV